MLGQPAEIQPNECQSIPADHSSKPNLSKKVSPASSTVENLEANPPIPIVWVILSAAAPLSASLGIV